MMTPVFTTTTTAPRRQVRQTAVLLFAAAIAYLMGTALFGVCWLLPLGAAYTLIDAVRWVRILVACVALFAFPIMVLGHLVGAAVWR